MLKRHGSQQRKTHHHAHGDNNQRQALLSPGALLSAKQDQCYCQPTGKGGAQKCQKKGIDFLDRYPGCGERTTENNHSHQAA